MRRGGRGPLLTASALLLLAAATATGAGEDGEPGREDPRIRPSAPDWAPAGRESQVRLNPGEHSIASLLDAILVQTGNHLSFHQGLAPKGVRARTVKVEKEQTGFWELLDMICDAGGLICVDQPTGTDSGLKLLPGARQDCPAARSGPGLLRVRAVEAHRDLRGSSEGAAELRLDVELLLEPRLVGRGGRGGFTFADGETGRDAPGIVLRTDAGQELACRGIQLVRAVDYEEKWSEWGSRQLLRFAAPPAGTRSLSAELGLTLEVASEPRLIRLPLDAGRVGGRADGVQFSVTGYALGTASARAESVALRCKGPGVAAWDWPWDRLRDHDGRLLRTESGGGQHGGGESETRSTLRAAWSPPQLPPAFVEALYYTKREKIRLTFKVDNLPWSLDPGKPQPVRPAEPAVELETLPSIPPVKARPKPPKPVKPPDEVF